MSVRPRFEHRILTHEPVGYRFKHGDVDRGLTSPHLSMEEKKATVVLWLEDVRGGRQLEQTHRTRIPGSKDLPVNVRRSESDKFTVNFASSRKTRIKTKTFETVEAAIDYKAISLDVFSVLDDIVTAVVDSV